MAGARQAVLKEERSEASIVLVRDDAPGVVPACRVNERFNAVRWSPCGTPAALSLGPDRTLPEPASDPATVVRCGRGHLLQAQASGDRPGRALLGRYDVAAEVVHRSWLSRTPCHDREVRVGHDELDAVHATVVVCPTCAALWDVAFPLGLEGVAAWTA